MIGEVLFAIGPLRFASFGSMAALGLGLVAVLLKKEIFRVQLDAGHAVSIAAVGLVGGVAGARLHYVLQHWSQVAAAPVETILTGSGLVWYGGLAVGALSVIGYAILRGIPVLLICDLAAPLLALGQAFGRMGCLLSGAGDYGPPSDVPWAIAFPRGVIPTTERVHPTPIYDMLVLLGVFGFLWGIRRREHRPGHLFGLYLASIGVGRFVTEFYRLNREVGRSVLPRHSSQAPGGPHRSRPHARRTRQRRPA